MPKRVVSVRVSKVKESTENQVLQIIKGNINHVFPNDAIEQLSEERLAICRTCVLFLPNERCDSSNYIAHEVTGRPVKGCGCQLVKKTKNYNSSCPALKWGAFDDEAAYLSERVKNNID